ncbi:GntR family transcriptional regulator [Microbacterium sp. 1.5R]|uniref:GntR family transcriptional regulator n=1 Tax=Microbacterium sp. 1.5R TaxID=1916917 RepID=UPI001C930862|nr:GntR family transcriptional regulator [Microbacterium sp. 1.5R]
MGTHETEEFTRAKSGEPAYVRIAGQLRSRIDAGELGVGAPLPSERDLSVELGVSRMTLRRALGVLENEGRVHRDATRGTFVSEPRVRLRLGSFSQEVARSGRQPGAELLWADERPADEDVAAGLGIPLGTAVYALRRLRRSNDEPLAVETTYYPADLVPGLLDGDLAGSLWDELRARFGLALARTSAELEVVVLDADDARRLGTRRAAGGLQLTRRTFLGDGACLEFAVDVYRADRVSLIIDRAVDAE